MTIPFAFEKVNKTLDNFTVEFFFVIFAISINILIDILLFGCCTRFSVLSVMLACEKNYTPFTLSPPLLLDEKKKNNKLCPY